MADFTLERLELLKEKLNLTVSKTEKTDAVLRAENQLIELSRRLEISLKKSRTDLSDEVRQALASIDAFAQEKLTLYSELEAEKITAERVEELEVCLSELIDLAGIVSQLDTRRGEIDIAYQEDVWNPFTATVMKEDVKKRLTRAYEKQMLPYILQQLENRLSCDNASDIAAMLQDLHARMLALRDEDTRRLERRVRRKDDALEILEMIGVSNLTWLRSKC
jgi:hypothetical protein